MKFRIASLCIVCVASALFAQTSPAGASSGTAVPASVPAPAVSAAPATPAPATASAGTSASPAAVPDTGKPPLDAPAVPDTYRGVTLGMDLETVKGALLGDSLFGYRGERDVSLLPSRNKTLIETVGYSFISRSWFQFYEEKLYIMTFKLDTDRVDYYSVYSSLVRKYGEPSSLDPRKAVWSDERVTLSLERPLTVKYVDRAVFDSLLDRSGTEQAASEMIREGFIDEF